MDCITNIDFTVLNWLHDTLSCRFLDSVMPVITKLGSKGIIWLAVAFVMMCTRKYRKCGILMVISLIAGVLIGNLFLKNIIARPRPCWINEDFPMLIGVPGDYSFPSGHTLSSAACATVLTLENRKFAYVAIPMAVLIAFSRLYLYVHFPTDVIGGALIGIAIGYTAFKLAKKQII